MTDTSPATRESVVAELIAESAAAEQPIEQVAEATAEAEAPTTEDNPDGSQPSDLDAAETPSEEEGEGEAAETPPSEAPHFWPAEAKARFAEMPVDLQLLVSESFKNGSDAITKRLEEATLSKKAADAEKTSLADLNARIAASADKAETAIKAKWSGMTPDIWRKLERDDPDKYDTLIAARERDLADIQQIKSAKGEADEASYTAWAADQQESLKTLAPHLVDPVQGPAQIKALETYLIANGVKEQDLPNVGALEMAIADKARKYDELQALKPAMKTSKPALRPAASTAIPSKQRAIEVAKNRFAQTGKREDAVALMLLEENQ